MNPPPNDRGTSPIVGYIVIFVLCVGGLAGAILGVGARMQPKGESDSTPAYTGMPAHEEPKPKEAPKPTEPEPATDGKLEITDIVIGKGAEAKSGDAVSAHYVGTLLDGKEFDASRKHGDTPFKFDLGKGRVIKGWDEGIVGMKVGGKRKLVIPPHLAYGSRGVSGTIPPNSTLVFEVELMDVKKP